MVVDFLFPPPYTCNECGTSLCPTKVQSNKGGNRGRFFISCRNLHTTSPEANNHSCKYFRWLTRRIAAVSTPLPPRHQVVFHTMAAPITDATNKCAVAECKKVRVNVKCTKHMCRPCCIQAGGCLFKDHLAGPTTVTPVPPPATLLATPSISVTPQLTSTTSPSVSSGSLASTSASASPTSSAGSSLPLVSLSHPTSSSTPSGSSIGDSSSQRASPNPLPHPRFSSHMTAVHTEQFLVEQQLREKQRIATADKKDAEKKVREQVTFHVWANEYEEANIQVLQAREDRTEIQYPFVTLSPTILMAVGLNLGDSRQLLVRNPVRWVKVDVGFIQKVSDDGHIFLKAVGVGSCVGFDALWRDSGNIRLHLRNHLPQERAHVRNALRTRKLVATSTVSANNAIFVSSDDDDDDGLSRKRKRQGTASSEVPSRRYREVGPSLRHPSIPPQSPGPSHHHPVSLTSIPPQSPPSFSGRILQSSSPPRDPPSPWSPFRERSPSVIISSPRSPMPSAGPSTKANLNRWVPKALERAVGDSWPRDFYVRDIVDGFDRIDKALEKKESTMEHKFVECFGVECKPSTYYGHRMRWKHSSSASQDVALMAGYTPDGLWSVFMASNPAPDAELRAAMRRGKGKEKAV
ncbi:hypothetical protein JAAARDRAFT_208063 [Jaapia argillacea MUCL 33604]|uniref:GRF-type domain-containing protein n=1 Tax=Jaapia argillacea MUCL 33604 TaxID=933084 RepID=A0A067PNJ2_9AGAM|nr:hypothetical protein JAAARDRAFT_208063 [Jaapia argillacea MUCL 33604]